jgi:hypothetical protein
MLFIENVETLTDSIEAKMERAERLIEQAQAMLDDAKREKAELNEALKEIARGGEPEIDRIYLTDAEGKQTDLYIAFTEANEAEGEAEVQKAVEGYLEANAEAEEERYIDEMERSRADYVAEDFESDWE